MNHYIDLATGELFAYSDEQVLAGIVMAGLEPLPTRPSKDHVWRNGWELPSAAVIPQLVTMRQGREALIRRGKIAIVDQAIASMAGIEGDIARNEWERSQVIERHRPLTASMFALIGVNDEAARDEWFVFASTL